MGGRSKKRVIREQQREQVARTLQVLDAVRSSGGHINEQDAMDIVTSKSILVTSEADTASLFFHDEKAAQSVQRTFNLLRPENLVTGDERVIEHHPDQLYELKIAPPLLKQLLSRPAFTGKRLFNASDEVEAVKTGEKFFNVVATPDAENDVSSPRPQRNGAQAQSALGLEAAIKAIDQDGTVVFLESGMASLFFKDAGIAERVHNTLMENGSVARPGVTPYTPLEASLYEVKVKREFADGLMALTKERKFHMPRFVDFGEDVHPKQKIIKVLQRFRGLEKMQAEREGKREDAIERNMAYAEEQEALGPVAERISPHDATQAIFNHGVIALRDGHKATVYFEDKELCDQVYASLLANNEDWLRKGGRNNTYLIPPKELHDYTDTSVKFYALELTRAKGMELLASPEMKEHRVIEYGREMKDEDLFQLVPQQFKIANKEDMLARKPDDYDLALQEASKERIEEAKKTRKPVAASPPAPHKDGTEKLIPPILVASVVAGHGNNGITRPTVPPLAADKPSDKKAVPSSPASPAVEKARHGSEAIVIPPVLAASGIAGHKGNGAVQSNTAPPASTGKILDEKTVPPSAATEEERIREREAKRIAHDELKANIAAVQLPEAWKDVLENTQTQYKYQKKSPEFLEQDFKTFYYFAFNGGDIKPLQDEVKSAIETAAPFLTKKDEIRWELNDALLLKLDHAKKSLLAKKQADDLAYEIVPRDVLKDETASRLVNTLVMLNQPLIYSAIEGLKQRNIRPNAKHTKEDYYFAGLGIAEDRENPNGLLGAIIGFDYAYAKENNIKGFATAYPAIQNALMNYFDRFVRREADVGLYGDIPVNKKDDRKDGTADVLLKDRGAQSPDHPVITAEFFGLLYEAAQRLLVGKQKELVLLIFDKVMKGERIPTEGELGQMYGGVSRQYIDQLYDKAFARLEDYLRPRYPELVQDGISTFGKIRSFLNKDLGIEEEEEEEKKTDGRRGSKKRGRAGAPEHLRFDDPHSAYQAYEQSLGYQMAMRRDERKLTLAALAEQVSALVSDGIPITEEKVKLWEQAVKLPDQQQYEALEKILIDENKLINDKEAARAEFRASYERSQKAMTEAYAGSGVPVENLYAFADSIHAHREALDISREQLAAQIPIKEGLVVGEYEKQLLETKKGAFIAGVEAGILLPSEAMMQALIQIIERTKPLEDAQKEAMQQSYDHMSRYAIGAKSKREHSPEDYIGTREDVLALKNRMLELFKENGAQLSPSQIGRRAGTQQTGMSALMGDKSTMNPRAALGEPGRERLEKLLRKLETQAGKTENEVEATVASFNQVFEEMRQVAEWSAKRGRRGRGE